MAERRKKNTQPKRPKARVSSKFQEEPAVYADDESFEDAKSPQMEYRSFNEKTYAKDRVAEPEVREKGPKKDPRYYQEFDEAKKLETRSIYKDHRPKSENLSSSDERPRREFRGERKPFGRSDDRNDSRGPRDDARGERKPFGRPEGRSEFRGPRDDSRGPRDDVRGEKKDFRSKGPRKEFSKGPKSSYKRDDSKFGKFPSKKPSFRKPNRDT